MSAPPSDAAFMGEALQLARAAGRLGEVPVGAVLVRDGVVIGRGSDARERTSDPTAHAEVLALREACGRLGSWRIPGAELFVTLEPCILCMGALLGARVRRVIYGARSPKSGAVESLVELARVPGLNHSVQVRRGVLEAECAAELSAFFEKLRSG